ncbi:MAG: cation:proton antiporter, partial [Chloroflexi bacterium]|nr:cation:proton antiporter [Chloroflexota bacterium]
MEADLALLALLVAGYALVAGRLERFSIGPSVVFLLIGILLSDDVLGGISLEPNAESVKLLAEVTLTLLLFADASSVRAGALRRDVGSVARLLVVGLLLTIALGTVGALLLFPGISLGMAMLIAAALAPTDAALGQPVVTNPSVPARIRRVLNVESGLNDGIATPFVFFALALATTEAAGGGGGRLAQAVADTAIGIAAGVVIGLGGGFLLVLADRRHWTSPVSRKLLVLALAAGCYLVAVSAGGNGFIAAFVGGLAFGVGTRQRDEDAVRFTETQGSLLAIGVWCAFGLAVAGRVLTSLWDPAAIVYAVLSLTAIRMVPVAIALLGERYRPLTVAFIGWFGPRGLASIVFLVIGISGLEEAGVDPGPLPAAIVWTVL